MKGANDFIDADGRVITIEESERRIFDESVDYTVCVTHGQGKRTTKHYRTFPEALVVALNVERSQLRCVTATGREFMMPAKQYPTYLKRYNELTGQKLGMPAPAFEKKKVWIWGQD